MKSVTILATGTALATLALTAPAHGAEIVGLFNTGTDESNEALVGGNGVVDTHYSILSSTSPGFAGQQAVTYTNPAYAANDADSRWISLSSNGSPGLNTTTYRLTFDLSGLDASTATISGLWGVDNNGTIELNGIDTGIALTGLNTANFSVLHSFSLSSGFVAGVNTLDFSVGDGGPPTALRVDELFGTANVAAVPEPQSWALMIAGFGLAGAAMRRRSRESRGFALA